MTPANGTVASVGVSGFMCPSDPHVASGEPQDFNYRFPAGVGIVQRSTSYGGCQGAWGLEAIPQSPNSDAQVANMNGTIFCRSSIRLADITDGTGMTLLFAETPYGRVPDGDRKLAAGGTSAPLPTRWSALIIR